jgi:Domain of unknown function (DUF4129)
MLKRSNLVQSILLPTAIAILIAAWLGPWVRWIIRATGRDASSPAPSSLAIALVILLATFITRYVNGERRARLHPKALIVVAGFVAIFGAAWLTYGDRFPFDYARGLIDWQNSIAPELIVLIAIALAWWRGILLGRVQTLSDETLERTFYNGIAALALLLIFNNYTQFVPSADMLLSVLAFFAIALSALTIFNIEHTRLRQIEPASPRATFNRHWLATIAAVVGAILLGGLSLTGIISPETLNRFIEIVRPLIESLGGAVVAILAALFAALFWLVTPLIPILQAIARLLLKAVMGGLSVLHSLGLMVDQLKAQKQIDSFLNSPEFFTLTRGVTVLVVLLIFVVISIWALRRWDRARKKELDETRENIATRQLLLDQLRALLARFRSRPATLPPQPYLGLSGPADDPRLIVRRTYQLMLDWARSMGYARFPYQTPSTYADALTAAMPESREPIAALTATYVRARYAVDPVPPDDARLAQASLIRLQTSNVSSQ